MARSNPRNQARYWRLPGMAGVELLHADFTTHGYAPHVHDALVIAMTEIGGSEFKSRGRAGLAEPGTLLVFNPGEPHSGRMAGSARWRYRSLYLSEPALAGAMRMLGADRPRYFTSNAIADRELVGEALALLRALDGAQDPLLQQERLVGTLGALFSRHGQLKKPEIRTRGRLEVLRPALELMHECHAQPLQLEHLAAVAGLTPHQLISAFKQATGLTPHAYLTQIRLRAALRLLDAGASAAEAALACGFYDQSALNNHLKKAFGITPLQYRRAA